MFESPWHWAVVAVVAFILFFGWKQLPEMSRSLGRSLRILKTEVKGMQDDDHARSTHTEAADQPKAIDPPAAAPRPVAAPVVTATPSPAPRAAAGSTRPRPAPRPGVGSGTGSSS